MFLIVFMVNLFLVFIWSIWLDLESCCFLEDCIYLGRVICFNLLISAFCLECVGYFAMMSLLSGFVVVFFLIFFHQPIWFWSQQRADCGEDGRRHLEVMITSQITFCILQDSKYSGSTQETVVAFDSNWIPGRPEIFINMKMLILNIQRESDS